MLLGLCLATLPRVAIVAAHANLDTSDPAMDAKLAQPPSTMTLRFTQGLQPQGTFVQVIGEDGVNKVAAFTFDPADAKVMRATLQPLGPGVYTVKYQSLSADDDDYHDGTYQFTVLKPDGSDPGAEVSSSQTAPDEDEGGSEATILAVIAAVILVSGALVFAVRYKRTPA